MAFNENIKWFTYERQEGRCALCGKEIAWDNRTKGQKGAWQAHHINKDNIDDRPQNCVLLCINEPDNCHLEAHFCDTKGDYMASTWFKHFYG